MAARTEPLERTELYHRYRPKTLDEVVGQDEAVKVIRGFGKNIPRALLFHGPSGTGKTTLARIVSRMVGCPPDNRFDYQEVNCGMVESALQTIREIHASSFTSGMLNDARFFVLDEVQSFSRAKFAQEAALKMLEDAPAHVYFALCTTDPKKIQATIRSRCTQIAVKSLSNKDIEGLVRKVIKAEKAAMDDRVIDKIVEVAAGSARNALVNLEKVIGLAESDRLASISAFGEKEEAFALAKALLPWKGAPEWSEVAKLLEVLKEEDPEGLRHMIMATARSQLLKQGNAHAFKVINCLRDPYYDRNSGHALLAADCYKAIHGTQR